MNIVGGFTVNTIYQYLSGAALSWGSVGSSAPPCLQMGHSY